MTSKEKSPEHTENRLKFLLALMTKDYDNAMKLGSSVLKENPNDLGVLKTLSAVKDKVAVNRLAESVGDDSDEDIPDEENMQTYCDTSDSDTESDKTESDDLLTIDANKCHQSTGLPAKNLSDCIKSRLFSNITKEGSTRDYDFKEKIYRILAVKTNDGYTSRTRE